ncbi:hypothetical protein [Actinomadura sp. DC4]|uniref:hypothetical protein n=1 Tax=Actinomadura sp. DC4 TaxID=3055069 RepID=UPI0025AF302A|nr:hypothetical protein [Actinomadura sp. DC4]MDN3352307.1 hypothetical protein [Actinomadura sp. DC4]
MSTHLFGADDPGATAERRRRRQHARRRDNERRSGTQPDGAHAQAAVSFTKR